MTTRAIVTLPEPNHQRVKVTIMSQGLGGSWVGSPTGVSLEKGESREFYVHGTQSLSIDEVE